MEKTTRNVLIVLLLIAVVVASAVVYDVMVTTQPVTCTPPYVKQGNQCVQPITVLKAYAVGYTYSEVNAYATGTGVTTAAAAYTLFGPSAFASSFSGNTPTLDQVTSLFGASSYKAIASGTTPTVWNIQEADHDKAFLAVHPGTNAYLNIAGFQGNSWVLCNDGSTSCANSAKGKWMPVSSQSIYDIVFEINTRTQEPQNTASPPNFDFAITFPLYPEDSSIANSVASATHAGSSGKTFLLKYTINSLTDNEAFEIAQLYFTSNQTTNFIAINNVVIGDNQPVYFGPGNGIKAGTATDIQPVVIGGQYQWSQPAFTGLTGAITTSWYYWGQQGSTQPGNGIIITNPTGASGDTVLIVSVTVSGTITDNVDGPTLVLHVVGIGPDGTNIPDTAGTITLLN